MLWPQVRRPFSCVPPCAGGQHHALVLHRARAQQQLPVRLTGGVGEGRRHAEHVAGRVHQRAVQLGKAQVVAHAQANAQRAGLQRHRRGAGLEHATFVVGFTAVVEGKQVHLVVARGLCTVGAEHQAAVAHALAAAFAQRQACRRSATDHAACACADRKRWIGPSPGVSATASLSVSRRPIRQKYSGSATSRAPAPAAAPIRPAAASRLRPTSGVDTICSAAIFMRVSPGLASLCAQGADGRCAAESPTATPHTPKRRLSHSAWKPASA